MLGEYTAEIVGLIGIALTAYLAWVRENGKNRKDKRAGAYAVLFDAQALATDRSTILAMQKREMGIELSDSEAKAVSLVSTSFAKAHAQILMNGSPQVVEALHDYYEKTASHGPQSPQTLSAFTALVRAMRADGNAKSYDDFEAHVDSIAGSGPARRQQQLTAANQAAAAQGTHAQ